MRVVMLVVLGVWLGASGVAMAGEYTPLDSAVEAYHYHEARRRAAIGMQLELNESLRWYGTWPPLAYPAPLPRWIDAAAQPIGRAEVQTGPNRWYSFPVYPEPRVLEPPMVVEPHRELWSEPPLLEPPLPEPPLVERPGVERPAIEENLPAPRPRSGPREF